MTRFLIASAAAFGVLAPAAAHAGWWETDWSNNGLASDLVHPTRVNFSYAPDFTNANSGTLVLFLPGSGMQPSDYQSFMKRAVQKGYYVVGLDYVNDNHEWAICGCETSCYGDLWKQSVEEFGSYKGFYSATFDALGTGESRQTLASHNAIGHRLPLFLNWLQAHLWAGETANWSQFIDASTGTILWSKVIVAGHSRGSDVATWMRLHRGTKAALGFSAINGYLNSSPASTCDTPAPYRQAGVLCLADGLGQSTCTPHHATPAWDPAPRSSPYPKLYVFDSWHDPNFDDSSNANNQYENTVQFGWDGNGASHDMDEVLSCATISFTSNWLVDVSIDSSHGSTVVDGQQSSFGARDCVWDHMLALP